jgi:hypothetical protein
VAVGLSNYHVRIYSLNSKGIEMVNSFNFKNTIESIAFLPHSEEEYALYVGAHMGKHFKWIIQAKTAQTVEMVNDSFTERNIKFFKLNVNGKPSLFRANPEPELTYQWQGQTQTCALPLQPLDLCAEMSIEGIQGTLIITYF